MSRSVALLALVVSLFLSACAAGTTVILLPDDGEKTGAITVKTEADSKVLDSPYNSVSAAKITARLSKTRTLSEKEVKAEYADLFKAEPLKPASFLLYFISNSDDLTEESMALIPKVVELVKERTPAEITVIGHADTTGTDAVNDRLSLERARAVEKILRERIPLLGEMTLKSFGSKELLVPTPPDVDEPRNRRVEVVVL